MGQAQAWHGPAAEGGKDFEHLFQRQIAVTQDVSRPDLPAFGSQPVSLGHILDGDEVQAGVDVSGHLAVEKVQNDAAGGRWLPIARAHGSGGIDDHHGLAAARAASKASCSARNFERL